MLAELDYIDTLDLPLSGMSQMEYVKKKLDRDGFMTRNEALRVRISRLGAIIHELKSRGWQFKTEWIESTRPDGSKGRDYKYTLLKKGAK